MAPEVVEPREGSRREGSRSSSAISVLIADDQPTVLGGLDGMIGVDGALKLVGISGCEGDTLSMVEGLCPDVVILGLCVEGKEDGLSLCRQIKSLPDAPFVLIHNAPDSLGAIAGAVVFGADGYLHKASPNITLPKAVKCLAGGEEVWEFAIGAEDYKARVLVAAKNNNFTPLEYEVFNLMREGMTNSHIARELHRSPHTIRDYTRNVLEKLEIEDRRHLYIESRLLNNI